MSTIVTILLAVLFLILGIIAYSEARHSIVSRDLHKPFLQKSWVSKLLIPLFYIAFYTLFIAHYFE